jgi:glycosyltransferase involved in cell wall biosynthesis
MPEAPKTSIITPSFNSIATIRDTIESVLRQEFPNWEHLVIDGGSTDGTVELLKTYPHLIWVSEKDEGHYHAMNKGVERATGEVVTILNSDDYYRPGALSKVADAFEANPDWDGLFGDVIYVDGAGQEIFRREEALFDYDVLRFGGVNFVNHQTLFVKKSVHQRLGLYRHKEFRNCCDYDFLLTLGRAKCRIGHVPYLLVNYRYHENGQSADLRITRNMAREFGLIRRAHGVPEGFRGDLLRACFRLKRQVQKLRYRGKCDLIPGGWILKKHMRPKTKFSSNIGLDKLQE